MILFLIRRELAYEFYKCKNCPKAFEDKRSLVHHNAIVHEGKKLYECSKCDSKFTQKQSMILHLTSVHEEKEPYFCEHCDHKFISHELKVEHTKSVHENTLFKCFTCEAKFIKKEAFALR